MNTKILMSILLGMIVFLGVAFAFFTAFHYCNDSKPEKVFLIFVGILSIAFGTVTVLYVLNA